MSICQGGKEQMAMNKRQKELYDNYRQLICDGDYETKYLKDNLVSPHRILNTVEIMQYWHKEIEGE
jgi:hypothetical protein